MSFFSNAINTLKTFYNEINPSTLTGAIDVIVVEQEDGSFLSSPFHVRFGKLGVLKAGKKFVDIVINGESVDIHMKLDDCGTAFFVEGVLEDENDEDLPVYLATSPLPDKEEMMESAGKINRKKRKRRSKHSRNNSKSSLKDLSSNKSESEIFEMDDVDEEEKDKIENTEFTISEKNPVKNLSSSSELASDSFLGSRISLSENVQYVESVDYETIRHTLPPKDYHYYSDPETTTSLRSVPPKSAVLSDTEYETEKSKNESSSGNTSAPCSGVNSQNLESWKWGELPQLKENQQSWYNYFIPKRINKSDNNPVGDGVFLEDLKVDDNQMMSLYLGMTAENSNKKIEEDEESGNGPSLPNSPRSLEESVQRDSTYEEYVHPDVSLSLCGPLDSPSFNPQSFQETMISYEDFLQKLSLKINLFDDNRLVIRINECYYTWKEAQYSIMSFIVYKMSLPKEYLQSREMKYAPKTQIKASSTNGEKSSKSLASWLIRWSTNSEKSLSTLTETTVETSDDKLESLKQETPKQKTPKQEVLESDSLKQKAPKSEIPKPETPKQEAPKPDSPKPEAPKQEALKPDSPKQKVPKQKEPKENFKEPKSELPDSSNATSKGKFKKTLRLSSSEVKLMNLKAGANEAEFSITTAFQGTTRCKCHIYLWKYTDKLVISDIDGTITKSDVLGHILPIIGGDWAQSGVASLFSKIKNNGYHMVYLSARAIGQASLTKEYLQSIRQGDLCLPDGPLLLNPTSLISAFHCEVIEKKPEQFKISCLKDIRGLFKENPFYAGYGNRANDTWTYSTVGIPSCRIFTINYKGELKHEMTRTFQTSYGSQSSIVDHLFPHRKEETDNCLLQYNSFSYWRDPILDIESS